jgi:small GTP-binding protein
MASADEKAHIEKHIKLVVVGDGGVGKTALLYRYVKSEFKAGYVPTVFDNYVKYAVIEGKSVHMAMWDTAGQEDYARLRPLSYPNTDVFVVAFDLVSKPSFANVASKWLKELADFKTKGGSSSGAQVKVVLIGCKADLAAEKSKTPEGRAQLVPDEDVAELLKKYKDTVVGYTKCSALTGEGVEDVFVNAAKACMQEPPQPKPCCLIA